MDRITMPATLSAFRLRSRLGCRKQVVIGHRGRSATKNMRILLLLLLTQISLFAQVSIEQKNDFLDRLKSAISAGSIDDFMALAYTEGISEQLLSSSKKQAEYTMGILSPRIDQITIEWKDITEAELKEMNSELQNAGYQFNLTPVTNLIITLPAETPKDPRLPADITFGLGIQADQLYRVGTIKTKTNAIHRMVIADVSLRIIRLIQTLPQFQYERTIQF